MSFRDTENKVIAWGNARNIYDGSNALLQFDKLMEEAGELITALKEDNYADTVDAIGDMMVVLTHIAKFTGVDLLHCYDSAYDAIRYRTGTLKNGIFVKDKE